MFFEIQITIVRIIISIAIVIAYVVLERSPLRSETLAFLSPTVMAVLLTFGSIYFRGDFLLFTYSVCLAMISLTYLKPKGLLWYVLVTSVSHAVILVAFGFNLLGASFTEIYNYLYFMVSVALNILVYIFCKFYTKSLNDLTEARNEAYMASLAKGTFLSNMSHEIRTPLNAILGMTAIGKTATEVEKAHYALTKIEDASAHLLGIINDVLDMSKIESGKIELSYTDFNLAKLLRSVINVVSFRMEEKKQDFRLHMDEDLPIVIVGDEQRIAQFITNLLGNAIKFTPNEGSVCLNVRLIREEDDYCTIQIEVVDSGIGISPEQQARLFQSFQQAETSISRRFGGTGLGLSISKNLIEMMGGNIWIESELGKGATFAFTFQAKRSEIQVSDSLDDASKWCGIRILAVDDDSGMLGYLKSFVERSGALCDTAQCGKDALDLAMKTQYNICFIDWKMSDMDGLQLAKELKGKHNDGPGPVIVMTSSSDRNDFEKTVEDAGVDRFIIKPFVTSDISGILNWFLGSVVEKDEFAPASKPANFKGKRVLLAEDVDINREVLMLLLEPTEIEIECAENGAYAVRMFSEAPEKYDLIFMDLQMPEMDGFEATRRIRAMELPKAQSIPIVAMTANVFSDDVENCLRVGMNGHIGKPLDMVVVLGILKKYLG